jgi:hypothetical protein
MSVCLLDKAEILFGTEKLLSLMDKMKNVKDNMKYAA